MRAAGLPLFMLLAIRSSAGVADPVMLQWVGRASCPCNHLEVAALHPDAARELVHASIEGQLPAQVIHHPLPPYPPPSRTQYHHTTATTTTAAATTTITITTTHPPPPPCSQYPPPPPSHDVVYHPRTM